MGTRSSFRFRFSIERRRAMVIVAENKEYALTAHNIRENRCCRTVRFDQIDQSLKAGWT